MAYRVDYTEMKRLRESGWTNADIAARLGCSTNCVSHAAKRFGWLQRAMGGQAKHVDVAKLFRMWHSEIETPGIAVELGVSVSTLVALRKKYALPKRPRRAVKLVPDPTPEEIVKRAKECRERHYAERRGETEETTLQWRQGGAA